MGSNEGRGLPIAVKNISNQALFSRIGWSITYLVCLFLAYVRVNSAYNWYGGGQITLALQEGAISRRFLIGTLFHPILNSTGYDARVLQLLSFTGAALFLSLVYVWYIKVGVEFKLLLLFGLLTLPGVMLITSLLFIEMWGYSFLFIALYMLDKARGGYLPFLFLALGFAASEHTVVFGSLIFILFAGKRFGYIKSSLLTALVAVPFMYLTLFVGSGEERMGALFEKVRLGSPKIDGGTYTMLISPILGFNAYKDGGLGAFSTILEDGKYQFITWEVKKWGLLFAGLLTVVSIIVRKSLSIFDLLLIAGSALTPIIIAMAANDFSRWMSMITINTTLLTYYILRKGERNLRLLGIFLVIAGFIITEFITEKVTFGGEIIYWYVIGLKYFFNIPV